MSVDVDAVVAAALPGYVEPDYRAQIPEDQRDEFDRLRRRGMTGPAARAILRDRARRREAASYAEEAAAIVQRALGR